MAKVRCWIGVVLAIMVVASVIYAGRFVNGRYIPTQDDFGSMGQHSAWNAYDSLLDELSDMLGSRRNSMMFTLYRLNVDSIRSFPHIDSARTVKLYADSIYKCDYIRGYPSVDSIAITKANVDSLYGLEYIRGNPEVDSLVVGATNAHITSIDTTDADTLVFTVGGKIYRFKKDR